MTSTLVQQAAISAAEADGVAAPGPVNTTGSKKSKANALRRGKWSPEEEAYAARLIQEFKAGLLPLTDGTTLRTFLSKLLNCDPMRISKKFVGSNCIGKQVFRRRTADLNRLTPEQIQQSRAELSELERRFLERVAQSNRVKTSSGGNTAPVAPEAVNVVMPRQVSNNNGNMPAPADLLAVNAMNPPWLQPPLGYRPGGWNVNNNRSAAAAGRAMLGQGLRHHPNEPSSNASLFAMAELQRRASQQSLLQSTGSLGNLLATARFGSAANQTSSNSNMDALMMRTGLSRDQLAQLAHQQGVSSNSLSNMIQRQSSFDALMSLDFQSLQSIDNLANLIQNGGVINSRMPESGMKNANFSSSNLAGSGMRTIPSSRNTESFLQSLSSRNFQNITGESSSNFSSLLQNSNGNVSFSNVPGPNASALFQTNPSAADLVNFLRQDSGTGLSALRMQEGLNHRNTSVDDFLSLVAAGDIPQQDATMLSVPLAQQQRIQQQQLAALSQADMAKFLSAQQQAQQQNVSRTSGVDTHQSILNGNKRKADEGSSISENKRQANEM